MTNYNKLKLAQATALFCTIITLLFAFNLSLLLLGLLTGWIMWGLGLTISLHRYSSHKSFTVTNKIIQYILLWCGTIITMGSAINFAAGHRQHHKFSDTDKDPYDLTGSLWHKIKLFFFWFPVHNINPLVIKDLIKDPAHNFFNRHYWKILLVYPIILLLINPILFGYFYALPVTYVLLGMGYVTVLAHLPCLHKYGTVDYITDDNSWNSKSIGIILVGEGNHNMHHALPSKWNYSMNSDKLDIPAKIINIIKD